MFLSRKNLRSFQAVSKRFPTIMLGDVASILNSAELNADSKLVALHDRIVLLSGDRKIVARVKLPTLVLERAVA